MLHKRSRTFSSCILYCGSFRAKWPTNTLCVTLQSLLFWLFGLDTRSLPMAKVRDGRSRDV